MSDPVQRLQKLAESSRSRRNMEKIQGELDNLQELRDSLEPWLEAAEEINEHVEEFGERFGEIDVDYLSKGAHERLSALLAELSHFLPHQESMLSVFVEKYDEVREGIEELESMLEDRDYTAEDRNEKWDETTAVLEEVANALDELSTVGAEPLVSGDEDEDDEG